MVSAKHEQTSYPADSAQATHVSIPEQDIHSLIAPAIRRVMSQSGVLPYGNGPAAETDTPQPETDPVGALADLIAAEFETVLQSVEESFAASQSRLMDLVRNEVNQALNVALTDVLGEAIRKVETTLGAALFEPIQRELEQRHQTDAQAEAEIEETSDALLAEPLEETIVQDPVSADQPKGKKARARKEQAIARAQEAAFEQPESAQTQPELETFDESDSLTEEPEADTELVTEQPLAEVEPELEQPTASEYAEAFEETATASNSGHDYEVYEPAEVQATITLEQDAEQEPTAEEPAELEQESPVAVSAASHLDELYEGVVKLTVDSDGRVKQVVHFVNAISQKPELRLLRLEGTNHEEGVEILLGLTEPLALIRSLIDIEGVEGVEADVEASTDDQKVLSVTLTPDE